MAEGRVTQVILEELNGDGTTDIKRFVPPKVINNPSQDGECESNHLQLGYS